MADVVERTPAVQYRLQLGLAGMVDGPANVAPVSKRLEQLLAYQAASRSGALPIQITSHASGGSDDWHSYRNGTYIHEHASSLTLSRPASAFTGIEKKTVGCLNYRDHIPDPDFTIGNCAVDSDQDLVVVTQLNLGECVQCTVSILDDAHALLLGPRTCTSCPFHRKAPCIRLPRIRTLKAS